MAGITLAQAQTQLDSFITASIEVAKNQEYWISGTRYRRADLPAILKAIDFWDNKVKTLSRGGIRIVGATPLD